MKRILIAAAMAAVGLSTAACGQRVKFDEAAVEVVEAGSGAGVQETEINTGRYWVLPFSYRYIVKFPKTIQTYRFEGRGGQAPSGPCFSFINADRVETWQCLSMNVQINPPDADNIVRKYKGSITRGGQDGYVLDDVVNGPVARELKQAFVTNGVKYTSAQLYADGGRALLTDVRGAVAPKFNKDGILILDILASSAPILPSDIIASIKGALKAQTEATRKDAELAATIAEGKKTVAEAQADAEARRLNAESIKANPEILKLEELKKHRGICPLNARVCVVGAGVAGVLEATGD